MPERNALALSIFDASASLKNTSQQAIYSGVVRMGARSEHCCESFLIPFSGKESFGKPHKSLDFSYAKETISGPP